MIFKKNFSPLKDDREPFYYTEQYMKKRLEHSKQTGEAGYVFQRLPSRLGIDLASGRLPHFSPIQCVS